WKTEIPLPGFNSPVIWNSRIYISGATKEERRVFCFDFNNGKLLWEKKIDFFRGKLPFAGDDTGYAAPTLASDGFVYALFGTQELVCLDSMGNIKWQKIIEPMDNPYGYASSLLVYSNLLFIQFDQETVGKIMALHTDSGNTAWETSRPVMPGWSSPALFNINNSLQLVLTANPIIAGYNPFTGAEIWRMEGMEGEVAPSAAFDKFIFAANEYASLMAIDPANNSIIWQEYDELPDVSSPVAQNGLLFESTAAGMILCYDCNNGKKLWKHQTETGFYSSPVITDSAVYFTDLKGTVYVFAAARGKKLLSKNQMGENMSATPAFYKQKIIFRSDKFLYCIGENKKQ
ncbi:MAG TPA: hypothetical protein DC049_01675, partial [Spirochaetia bacterium]|nr:hypothetical protein [Spirochaetia bacterium]